MTARFSLLLCLILLGRSAIVDAQSVVAHSQSKTITVEDVIKLTKAGLNDDIIIQQIRKSGQTVGLSTDQLLQLKSAQVSDRVIQALIDSASTDEKAVGSAGQKHLATSGSTLAQSEPACPAFDPHSSLHSLSIEYCADIAKAQECFRHEQDLRRLVATHPTVATSGTAQRASREAAEAKRDGANCEQQAEKAFQLIGSRLTFSEKPVFVDMDQCIKALDESNPSD